MGESRRPGAIGAHGVPADMVDVKVSAEHDLGRSRVDADPAQPIEVARTRSLIPGRYLRPVLVLADAGVDEEDPPRQPQHEGLDRAPQDFAADVDKFRLEDVAILSECRQVEARQELARRQLEVIIVDDYVDDDLPMAKRMCLPPIHL